MRRRIGRSSQEGLGADRIFDEEGGEIFDQVAAANGVGEVEALVEVDAPVAVFADTFARLRAFVVELVHSFVRVVSGVGGKRPRRPSGRRDSRLRWWLGAFLDAHPGVMPGIMPAVL